MEKALIQRFERIIGKHHVHSAPEVLKAYECDALVLMKHTPALVVLPGSTQEVAQVVQLCRENRLPFIARGSGTGLSGGALPVEGSVIVGLSRMNRILEINVEDRTATVEAGVINAWLNRDARGYGLFYAPDPSSQAACTMGGNIAENAGGIHCLKYGVTVDHILALEVVTSDGEIVWLGGSHGHHRGTNWAGIFVGSEGTFGIVTRAIVRLLPLPESIKAFLCAFSALEDATDAVAEIVASGIKPAALEFMDEVTVRAVNQAFGIGFPEDSQAVLLIELDGTATHMALSEKRLLDILETRGITQLRTAETDADRQRLWQARKGAVSAYGRILPAFYLHDCVIPRSELTRLLRLIQAIGRKYNVIIGNVFHAGDGNLHPNILLDPGDADMVNRVLQAGEEILKACVSVGGVLSGEHGIGAEKAHFMPLLFSDSELAVMHRLKELFDPENLANPEKIFPVRSGCGEVRQGLSLNKIMQSGVGWI